MFAWRRKLPPSSIAAFLVAGGCAVAAFVAVDGATSASAGPGPVTMVAVAVTDIAPGDTLDATDMELRPVPASVMPPAAVTDPATVQGRTAVTPFVAGEIISETRLALGGGPLSVSVPAGLVAITVVPDAVPEGIGEGDRVDVVATYLTARPYAATVGEDLAVLAVGDSASGVSAPALTLVADAFTAAELARADATATLAIAVRGSEPLP